MIRLLKVVYAGLLSVARLLGRVNTFVLLALSYYLILFPVALIRRISHRETDPNGWLPREPLPKDHYRKQY